MSKFIIGTTDLTGQINTKKSYKMNAARQYTAVTDANGVEHRTFYRERVTGSFEMVFISGNQIQYGTSYADFLTLISQNSTNGVLLCTVYVQNKGTTAAINCYLDITIKKESEVNGYTVTIANITIKEC